MIMKRILLLPTLLFFAGHVASYAQFTVQDNVSPAGLVEYLTGTGVVITNIKLNGSCPTTAVGKFNHGSAPHVMGIDSGIVLTNGRAMTVGSDYGANAAYSDFATASFNGPGDPDLTALANMTTNDACVLEFDFVPAGDTVLFEYVFASEEYNGAHGNFNCSMNDVFGFFISGGTQYPVPENIALIPGTTLPVGVSTVNDGVGGCSQHTQYYNDNVGSTQFVYSGYTDVFTAMAIVTPCDTYHLKLAIADGGDYSYDSGVFLKAGSLNSIGLKIATDAPAGANAEGVAHAVRGCKSALVNFEREDELDQQLILKYNIAGTAVNGVDYVEIIDSVVFAPFQTSAQVEIQPLLVPGMPTGVKEVKLQIKSPYVCPNNNELIISEVIVEIYDSLYVNIVTQPTTSCPNDLLTIEADIDPSLSFVWTPETEISNPYSLVINPNPTKTTEYTITVSQPGSPGTCPSASATFTATVEPYPVIMLPSKDTTVCLSDSISLNVFVTPENIAWNALWQPSDYLRDNSSLNNKFFSPDFGDYHYTLEVKSPIAGCKSSDNMVIRVIAAFDFEEVYPADTTINYGDRIQLDSESEAISWYWYPPTYLSNASIKNPWAQPLKDITYTLVGVSKYGCMDTTQINIKVEYESKIAIPNAFSPNGDGVNDVFSLANLKFETLQIFQVYNRYGQLVFETMDKNKGWDGTFKGENVPADVYYYNIMFTTPVSNEQKQVQGDLTLLR